MYTQCHHAHRGRVGLGSPKFKRHHWVKVDVFGKNICICRCPLSTFDSIYCAHNFWFVIPWKTLEIQSIFTYVYTSFLSVYVRVCPPPPKKKIFDLHDGTGYTLDCGVLWKLEQTNYTQAIKLIIPNLLARNALKYFLINAFSFQYPLWYLVADSGALARWTGVTSRQWSGGQMNRGDIQTVERWGQWTSGKPGNWSVWCP